MARKVEEWIAATDDQRAPPRVRERIFTRDNTCNICKCEIQILQKWDLDNVVALINGSENREVNLRPAHRKYHVEKTAIDLAEKAKVAAVLKKHLGITQPKKKIKGPSFAKSEKAATRDRNKGLPPFPRDSFYEADP